MDEYGQMLPSEKEECKNLKFCVIILKPFIILTWVFIHMVDVFLQILIWGGGNNW